MIQDWAQAALGNMHQVTVKQSKKCYKKGFADLKQTLNQLTKFRKEIVLSIIIMIVCRRSS